MTSFVYFNEKEPALIERWLSECRREITVSLLSKADGLDHAKRLKAAFPSITEVLPLHKSAKATTARVKMSAPPCAQKIVIPFSCAQNPARFLSGVRLPEIAPVYPVIRELWLFGFREFELYSLGGTCNYFIPHLLDEYRDCHKGRRCFVVGNGPSLNQLDITRLRNEITFGSNRVYLGFESWGFAFNYWGVVDRLQIEEYGPEYERHISGDITAFFPFEYLSLLRFANGCPMNYHADIWPAFSNDCAGINIGHSVTYALMQVAAVMGCNEIILIGVDHRYNLKPMPNWKRGIRKARMAFVNPLRGTPLYKGLQAWKQARNANESNAAGLTAQFWQVGDSTSPTHFDDRYASGQNRRFLVPEPVYAETDYRCAANWAKANNVQIFNASPNSALTVFPMISYDSLF